MVSTGLLWSTRLTNKAKQNYNIFAIFSLAVIGLCEVDEHPHISLTIPNQHIKEINRNFDGNLIQFVPVLLE